MSEVRQRDIREPSTTQIHESPKVGRDAKGKKVTTVSTRFPTTPFYDSSCWKATKGTIACTTISVIVVAAAIFLWITKASE